MHATSFFISSFNCFICKRIQMLSYIQEQTVSETSCCSLTRVPSQRILGVFTPRLKLQKWSANGADDKCSCVVDGPFIWVSFHRGEAYTQLSFTLHSGLGFSLSLKVFPAALWLWKQIFCSIDQSHQNKVEKNFIFFKNVIFYFTFLCRATMLDLNIEFVSQSTKGQLNKGCKTEKRPI